MKFNSHLTSELLINLSNNFGEENYDHNRFGPYTSLRNTEYKTGVLKKIAKYFLHKNNYFNKQLLEGEFRDPLIASHEIYKRLYDDNLHHFEYLYNALETEESKGLLIKILAHRILGFTKVKLPTNNKHLWESLASVDKHIVDNEVIDVGIDYFKINHYKLDALGYPIEIFLTGGGIVIDFILKQYFFSDPANNISIEPEKGDFVIDAGACYADTALLFAHHVGALGKVFSFEFEPGNLKTFKKNVSLNPTLEPRIQLVENPLWDKSDLPLYYFSSGPGTIVSFDPLPVTSGKVPTITIDDFVERKNIPKIDFIKMDIEGAELKALKGAINSLKKFKPKLAICIYHQPEDFGTIPKFLNELNLGYKFYLGHYTINPNETVLYAKVI